MITVFKLLHGAIDGQTPDLGSYVPEPQKWWSLFRLLQRNHCAALAYRGISLLPKEAQPPRDVLIPWLSEQQKAIDWHRYQQQVQQEIVDTMAHHGIETLVLKGTHTAQYYPQPELREFGDLDLYFGDRHSEADQVARQELNVTVSDDSHHHTKYDYRGVTVESHYDFVNTYYPCSNRSYEQTLKELVSADGPLSTTHYPLSTFEVLFLLRHMAGHFAASRITLRDLVDWTLTCRALEHQVDWAQVQEAVERFGMAPFATAVNRIAKKRLGYGAPLSDDGGKMGLDRVEHDIVYGSTEDYGDDGLGRLGWKLRRWHEMSWKRKMVYNDSPLSLWLASLTSHGMKPQSILHKM